MANRVDRAFGRCPDRRDADIDRIHPNARPARKHPLRGAGGRSRARPCVTHNSTLRASECDVVPALIRRFIETKCAVIHKDTG